jgi:hypothetical protein
MTYNEAALERMFVFLRRSGNWRIADGIRDGLDMANLLQAQRRGGQTLSPDEEAFVRLMELLPAQVGDLFGSTVTKEP